VGDVADCFAEVSFDGKRSNFALQQLCYDRAEMCGNREIKSRNQSEYETEKRQKKNEGSFSSHDLDI